MSTAGRLKVSDEPSASMQPGRSGATLACGCTPAGRTPTNVLGVCVRLNRPTHEPSWYKCGLWCDGSNFKFSLAIVFVLYF